MRNERGQTAAEYLGMIVVVAAIVGALATTEIGAKLTGGIQDAICRIAGGSCEADAAEPVRDANEDGGGGGETEGPAFGDGEFPVPSIPWDGTFSATANTGDDLYLKGTVTESRKACTLNADGDPVVDLSVTGTLQAGAKAEGKKGSTGASVEAFTGKDVSYGITTDPDHADDFQDGQGVPSPVDPTSIPEGTALTLSEGTFDGLNLGASYRGIQASLGYKEGTSVASSVRRVDDDTVRVSVGDADFINQTAALGIPWASVGTSATSTSAKAKQVDIDISTPAGQAAYASFIESGRLPTTGAGIEDPVDISSYTREDALKLGFDPPGPLGGSLDSNQVTRAITTTDADGNKTYSLYDGGQDITRSTSWTENADGTESELSTTFRYAGLTPGEADLLHIGTNAEGLDIGDDDRDVSVTYTESELEAIHAAAVDAQRYLDEEDLPSNLDIDKIVEWGPSALLSQLQQGPEPVSLLLQDIRRYATAERFGDDDRPTEEEYRSVVPAPDVETAAPGCD